MEAAHLTPRSVNPKRAPSDAFAPRARTGNERESTRMSTPRTADEDRAPTNLPKALESMLKTTTETGDIGMFSIKPLRVPRGHTIPRRTPGRYDDPLQKPRQTFQPYGVPTIDDRRRLPSYARDATSEVVSMYETASQKSASRVFDDPDYRSYSMTQTSYSAYTLSNHRSYASLRSHPDINGPLRRPRSPFAYPARLKRPGFRPSSPALTDGGMVDYSRRAEIDRSLSGLGHSTSSPSSLYAQKRKPPLLLRPEGNRSTPSLLSQPSPPQRSSSPYFLQSNRSLRNEGFWKNGPSSLNTSPARSTFNLASTVNLCATLPASSAASTPGKLVPPSPLYYDYTEEFHVGDYQPVKPLVPPPHFHIDNPSTGAEPLGENWTFARVQETSSSTKHFIRAKETTGKSKENLLGQKAIESGSFGREQEVSGEANATKPPETIRSASAKKVFRLSGLGYGARELSDHVEEAFGLHPSPSFEISLQQNGVPSPETSNGAKDSKPEKGHYDPQVRSLPRGLVTDIQRLPLTPRDGTRPIVSREKDVSEPQLAKSIEARRELQQANVGESKVTAALEQQRFKQANDESTSPSVLQSESLGRIWMRSSGFSSIDGGLTELAGFISNLDNSNGTEAKSSGYIPPGRTPMASPTLPDESFFRRMSSSDRSVSPPTSVIRSRSDPEEEDVDTDASKERHVPQKGKKRELPPIPDDEASEVPNFSQQIPRKYGPRSESPMLAPKPISPARQLKLKNSIPQLMKALPPLPPEPHIRAVHPPTSQPSPDLDLPCQFSPLMPESRSPSIEEQHAATDRNLAIPKKRVVDVSRTRQRFAKDEGTGDETADSGVSPPRLKLKMKNATTARSFSPPESRPWNIDDSYPWSSQESEGKGPAITSQQMPRTPKHPKFKLKITRATNLTEGTVRIHRDSTETNSLGGLHFPHPKDLFTQSGIDNIFRQVSRHLHSLKSSGASSTGIGSSHRRTYWQSLQDGDDVPPPLTPTNALGIFETRSGFSDDSSQLQGGQGLRKRISNLRARIAVPYTSRFAAHSFDDITWRDRNPPEPPTSPAVRSFPNLHSSRTTGQTRQGRRFAGKVHGQWVKAKMRAWIQGARSRIASRLRSRARVKGGSNDNLLNTQGS